MILVNKQLFVWCTSLMLLQGCLIPSRYFMRQNIFIKQSSEQSRTAQTSFSPIVPTVTVWIHGTRFFYHRLYQQGIPYHEGLLLAKDAVLPFRLKNIGQTLHRAAPSQFNATHFYVFGWSGKLCFAEREEAAKNLLEELIDLRRRYREIYNCTPHLRLIAHSHGGNVALNLTLQENNEPLIVDELILLACPVQEKTMHLIEHPMFKKVYALYSALDIVQILDPQGMYKNHGKTKTFFSKRNFPHKAGLAQMKIKVNNRAITHFEFTQNSFLSLLPGILTGIDLWHKDITYKTDPNKIHKVLCVYTQKPKTKTPVITI